MRILTCVYCGHTYPQDTPSWGHEVLTEHIKQCPSHPMKVVISERDRLREALVGIVGASKQAELVVMLQNIQAIRAAEEDMVPICNAIQALIDTSTD